MKSQSEVNAEVVFLPFPEPQYPGIFLGRPQRFLAGIKFDDGTEELVYCANPGSMAGCLLPGNRALVWDSADSKRKRRYTLRAVELGGVWIGTDTHLSNRIVEEALKLKLVPGLDSYELLAREVSLEEGMRVDFILSSAAGRCVIEVKSASIVESGIARYPDSLTPRGVKHLKTLAWHAARGTRTVLLFLVQRADAHSFVVSNSFDPEYAAAFDEAVASGVEVVALGVTVDRRGFGCPRLLPYGHESLIAVAT